MKNEAEIRERIKILQDLDLKGNERIDAGIRTLKWVLGELK